MQTLVVYFSKFGNTQQVAEVIAGGLSGNGAVITLSSDKLTDSALQEANLVVMGTPTHNMNLPKVVQPVFDGLPRKILSRKLVAAFDTSYKMSAILARFTAAKKLSKKMRKLGGRQIVPPETFHVKDREGPLFEGEVERAQSWAAGILEKMQDQN